MVVAILLIVLLAILIIGFIVIQFPFAKPLKKVDGNQSLIIRNKTLHEGHIRRALGTESGLLTEPFPGVKTLYDIFERGLSNGGDGPCLGHRHASTGKYHWESYEEIGRRRTNFASGLVGRGGKKGTLVALFASNCPGWVIASQACNAQSMVVVPLYDTLGVESCVYILNQTEAPFLIVGKNQAKILPALLNMCSAVKLVITMEETDKVGEKFISFKKLEEEGAKNPVEHNPPSKEDISTICYTSGTTGKPKGALISHGNLTADVAGISKRMEVIGLKSCDVHISYLPLAHMYERLMQEIMFCYGGSIGFYRGDITKIFEDITAVRPTFFVSVPRIYSRLYDRIKAGVERSGKIKQLLFNAGYKAKAANLKKGIIEHWFWDRLVFQQIRSLMGGRLRLMVTGAAPIPDEVMTFLRCCFSCVVLEGYGQTECSAAATSTLYGDFTVGHVGPPIPCVEIKLIDVPEMMYFSTDMPLPRGEICFRGPVVFSGYYKPDKDVEHPITEDGWLRSGDIGQWNLNQTLSIIDRKKNIFKLAQGEYVAPERVEGVYLESPFISQIFVYGHSFEARLVAIIIPNEEYSLKYAKDNGIKADSLDDLCFEPSFKEAIMFDMKTFAAKADLKGFESVADIALSTDSFTIENGLLTPTYKLKRTHVYKVFQREIAEMYRKLKE